MDSMKYVKIYDDVVTKEFCEHLINKYQSFKNLQKERKEENFVFNEINLSENSNFFNDESEFLIDVFYQYVQKYQKDSDLYPYQFPSQFAFESIRMKHYKIGEGEFKPHVDTYNLDSSGRFLVFFLYLDEGIKGGTHFFDQNITCERKPGRLLMFPPNWTYPHAGLMPEEKDKYIIGSYLHFSN